MKKLQWILALLAVAIFCNPPDLRADILYGVTSNNFLISWHATTPGTLNSGVALSGLQVNEQIVGLDVRPATGEFFAIGSSNRAYTINRLTGVATQVGPAFPFALNGSQFGYDFNPTIDRSRIVSDARSNYVVNPDTGGITQVTDVFYANGDANFGVSPNVVHLAYDNNVDGALTSQLFAIDSGLDIVARLANSAGTMNTVGSLGLDINGVGGFDISGRTGLAYGAFQTEGSSLSRFYTVDLTTGLATDVGQIGAGTVITALTVQAIPEPSLAGLGCLAALGLFTRRTRYEKCMGRK